MVYWSTLKYDHDLGELVSEVLSLPLTEVTHLGSVHDVIEEQWVKDWEYIETRKWFLLPPLVPTRCLQY